MNLKNPRTLIPQILTVASLVGIIAYFAFNAQVNMGNRGISFGYGFLSQEASFDIGFSLIEAFKFLISNISLHFLLNLFLLAFELLQQIPLAVVAILPYKNH